MLQIPFFLHLFLQYGKKEDFQPEAFLSQQALNNIEVQHYLFRTFIQRAPQHKPDKRNTKGRSMEINSVLQTLQWIAQHSKRLLKSTFSVEELQPSDLKNLRSKRLYVFFSRLGALSFLSLLHGLFVMCLAYTLFVTTQKELAVIIDIHLFTKRV